MSVAGMFYPNSKSEIIKYIEHFNENVPSKEVRNKIKGIIVPHAGYIYSGFTANLAYRFCATNEIKRIIVIGPSHRVYVNHSSICLEQNYETPLGNIPIDIAFAQTLQEKFSFLHYQDNAHAEHSTETQMPFIKHYFPQSKVVEIVYGKQDEQGLSEVIDFCMAQGETLVVISTDLSHFYTLKEANILDNICIQGVVHKDLQRFDEGCEACGLIGVKAMINSAIKSNLTPELLHYCTSFDRSGDDKKVVGYASFLLSE
jgi:AmmeMemoRadiSam system protein B